MAARVIRFVVFLGLLQQLVCVAEESPPKEAWERICEYDSDSLYKTLQGYFAIEDVPAEYYGTIRQIDALLTEAEPSEADIEKECQKKYGMSLEQRRQEDRAEKEKVVRMGHSPEKVSVDLAGDLIRHLKQKRFQASAQELLRGVERAANEHLLAKLISSGTLGNNAETIVIFIPCPTLGKSPYEQVESFMLATCVRSCGSKTQIAIVDSPYGSVRQRANSRFAPMGGDRLREYPNLFKKYIETGCVTLLPSWGRAHDTPYGLVFKRGKLLADTYILKWTEDPEALARLLAN